MIKEPFEQKSEQFLLMDEWKNLVPGLIMGFTTRHGGTSMSPFTSLNLGLHVQDSDEDVCTNRIKLSELLGFPTSNWACSEQVHDKNIVKITKDNAGQGVFDYETSIKNTDGIYTSDPNILLTSCYADCVPLYFLEPRRNLIGVAHAGWKGSVKNIAREMIRNWEVEEGVNPEEIFTAIGPAIGSCCYIVDDYVINMVKETMNFTGDYPFVFVSKGQYSLDLKKLNKTLMVEAGIRPENIRVSSYCTSCEDNLFFSHRRDQGKTGRMLSFIGVKDK